MTYNGQPRMMPRKTGIYLTIQCITGAVMDTKKYLTSTAMLNYDEPECKENRSRIA